MESSFICSSFSAGKKSREDQRTQDARAGARACHCTGATHTKERPALAKQRMLENGERKNAATQQPLTLSGGLLRRKRMEGKNNSPLHLEAESTCSQFAKEGLQGPRTTVGTKGVKLKIQNNITFPLKIFWRQKKKRVKRAPSAFLRHDADDARADRAASVGRIRVLSRKVIGGVQRDPEGRQRHWPGTKKKMGEKRKRREEKKKRKEEKKKRKKAGKRDETLKFQKRYVSRWKKRKRKKKRKGRREEKR
jgi:hypothetical protein